MLKMTRVYFGVLQAATTTARFRVCFAVKLSSVIPYYEKDLPIIKRVEVYIYILK